MNEKLLTLKEAVHDKQDADTWFAFLDELAQSTVYVPMQRTEEDEMLPILLEGSENPFFLICTNLDRIPEQQKNEFEWAKMDVSTIIDFIQREVEVSGIVVDVFTQSLLLTDEHITTLCVFLNQKNA